MIPDYAWKFAVGGLFVLLGALSPLILKSAWDDYNTPAPKITLRRFTFFWVEADKDIYQIGAVIRLFNLGDKPYLVKGVALDASKPTYYGRGQTYLRQIFVTGSRTEITDDNFMRPASDATFKMLLPIKFEATITIPPPMGILFVGQWSLLLGKIETPVEAEYFGTYNRVISKVEWSSINGPNSEIRLDDVEYQGAIKNASTSAPYKDFVLFNPDRSADFKVFGFAQTPAARASAGTIVYIRGQNEPPLDGGWTIIGRSYEEVWADPAKRALYNSIFPPEANGEPRKIAVFQ